MVLNERWFQSYIGNRYVLASIDAPLLLNVSIRLYSGYKRFSHTNPRTVHDGRSNVIWPHRISVVWKLKKKITILVGDERSALHTSYTRMDNNLSFTLFELWNIVFVTIGVPFGKQTKKLWRHQRYTVDSRSNGSAYNRNPSLTTFLFVPMEFFLLLCIMAITTFHSNSKFH